ncbi:MAG: hypothetical protein RIS70_1157, partial [Planctomycetota bacterium]
ITNAPWAVCFAIGNARLPKGPERGGSVDAVAGLRPLRIYCLIQILAVQVDIVSIPITVACLPAVAACSVVVGGRWSFPLLTIQVSQRSRHRGSRKVFVYERISQHGTPG